MTYTVILFKGEEIRPAWTIEADTTKEAWEKARRLFPMDVLTLVADDE